MTITITSEHVYIGIIVILGLLQLFQWRVIYRVARENESLWDQVGILAASISNQIISIQKDLLNKQDKNRLKN